MPTPTPAPLCVFSGHVAGVPFRKPDFSTLAINSRLAILPEPTNEYDKNAVAVYAGNTLLGYIPAISTYAIHHAIAQGYSIEGFIHVIDPLTKWKEILIHVYAELLQ